jgi:hypothetical protein
VIETTEVPPSATHVLSVGDRSVTLAGPLSDALRARSVDGSDAPVADDVPADLIVSRVDDGLIVQHRALDAHRRAVGDDVDLAEEIWSGALDLVIARDRARWHLPASALDDHGTGVLLIGAAAQRHAVANALVSAGARPLARDLVAFWPGLRIGVGDGDPWVRAGVDAPAGETTSSFVAGVIVELDAESSGDPEDDVRVVHRAEGVQHLAAASRDLGALVGGAIPSLLAVVAGATIVRLREPDPELTAEVIAELRPPTSRAPTWHGTGAIRSTLHTGWVDGIGLFHDADAGTIELVGDVGGDPEFRPSSPASPRALGLANGPRPWLDAVPSADGPTSLETVSDALAAFAGRGEEVVLVGDLADSVSGCCPDGWVPWSVPVPVLKRADARVESPSDDVVAATTLDALGLPAAAADELVASAIPVPLTRGRWALRLHPTHRFLVACATARPDQPDSLRSVAANAPADPAGVEAAFTCADRWDLRGVVDDAIRQTATALGGIPEIWHQHFYGRRSHWPR